VGTQRMPPIRYSGQRRKALELNSAGGHDFRHTLSTQMLKLIQTKGWSRSYSDIQACKQQLSSISARRGRGLPGSNERRFDDRVVMRLFTKLKSWRRVDVLKRKRVWDREDSKPPNPLIKSLTALPIELPGPRGKHYFTNSKNSCRPLTWAQAC